MEVTPHPGPNPGQRLGPRPLGLHLAAAQATWRRSTLAWASWSSGSPNWSPPPEPIAALAGELAETPPETFAAALETAIARRGGEFLAAVTAYRRHPYRRALNDPPVLWHDGSSRLLDFGVAGAAARPLLLVPSLVNRGYILDLAEGRSFARWIAARGFRPLLLDWGDPGEAEAGFTLTDYVAGRLESALDAILAEGGGRPLLLGYCMGGLLALALALRRQEALRGLALLATPWDFHAVPGQAALGRGAALTWAPVMELLGVLPVDAVQALFTLLDPLTAVRKFRRFAALDPASAAARDFVALEDWLNDGVALAAPVARECLGGWYARNDTLHGRWRVAGQAVEPALLDLPTLCLVPTADRIVPPASALALAAAIPGAAVQRPAVGHIGMMASGRAETRVWPALADWLAAVPEDALRGPGSRSKVTANAAVRRAGSPRGAGQRAAATPGRKRRRSDPA